MLVTSTHSNMTQWLLQCDTVQCMIHSHATIRNTMYDTCDGTIDVWFDLVFLYHLFILDYTLYMRIVCTSDTRTRHWCAFWRRYPWKNFCKFLLVDGICIHVYMTRSNACINTLHNTYLGKKSWKIFPYWLDTTQWLTLDWSQQQNNRTATEGTAQVRRRS